MKRSEVLFPLFAHTMADACKAAWERKFAFFAHEGKVWLVLGPGKSEMDWMDSGVEIRELRR